MELSFFSVSGRNRFGLIAGKWPRPTAGGPIDESSDDLDDAGDNAEVAPNDADPQWWRDFGADFDDDEPEPEPGDFWPEIDDACCPGDRMTADAGAAQVLAARYLLPRAEFSTDENYRIPFHSRN